MTTGKRICLGSHPPLAVCAPGGPERLGMSPQHVVCAFVPPDFYAVGSYYEDFGPTGDDEVIARLEAADARIRRMRAHRT